MLRNLLTLSVALLAGLLIASDVSAQCSNCGGGGIKSRIGGQIGGRLGGRVGGVVGSRIGGHVGSHRRLTAAGATYDADGMTSQAISQRVGPKATLKAAVKDKWSPHRVYSYSNAGVTASHHHAWNQQQMDNYSWHGGYKNWQWGTPTAVVVPPTSGYQSSYAWGVGQVRSTPIHHQFGSGAAASIGGGTGGGLSTTPYWPQSTDQFGLYPVRGPW